MKMGGLVEKSSFDAASALVKSDIELASKSEQWIKLLISLEKVNIQTVGLLPRSPAATDLRYAPPLLWRQI